MLPGESSGTVRLAELIAALSLATDLAMSQPLEFALRACIVAMRLGDSLGLADGALSEVFYQSLLRYIGCNAESHAMAALFGDELALREDVVTADTGRVPEIMGILLRHVWRANAGASPLRVARAVTQGLTSAPAFLKGTFSAHCEVAQRLAERLGFGVPVVEALGQLYERWDGRGMPNARKGEEIALSVRIVSLAQDAVTVERVGGLDSAIALGRDRRGSAYDPKIADVFRDRAAALFLGIDDEPSWDVVLDLEPAPRVRLTDERLGRACEAIADFADLKSPYTISHSTGVANLAAEAARRSGLPAPDIELIRRAGLVHDVGRVGVSSGIWGKVAPLSDRDWEKIRLHPYYTERILSRPAAFARLGALASLNHERVDGSGYHWGIAGSALSPVARILAAADVYHAMLEPRPQRPAR
jgi:HD-GYP domain-containing protein (c-di-GMP phosphodiesterase class II)